MKKVLAIGIVAAMLLTSAAIFALDYGVPEHATVTTSRWTITDMWERDGAVSMINEEGDLVIHITDETLVYFEQAIPVGEPYEDGSVRMTQMAREVLEPGQTLAELLDGRELAVTYGIVAMSFPGQTTPISVRIMFETAVHLPGDLDAWRDSLRYDGDSDAWTPGVDVSRAFELNGEIVVNGEIVDAPAPFVMTALGTPADPWSGVLTLIPLRAVAEALGYDVTWNEYTQSVQLGVAIHVFIGRAEAYRGRMAPIELYTAPVIMDNSTFVSWDFFQAVLDVGVSVVGGQVRIYDIVLDMF